VSSLLLRLGYEERELTALSVLSAGSRLGLRSSLEGVEAVEVLVAIGGG
jgi:hypothetical protein